MKAVILAGGLGTRLSEETQLRPKPMVEIGGRPILWHILKGLSQHGIHDFVICCGYKGYVIKEYFANYVLHNSDVTFDLANRRLEIHHQSADPWRVTLVDTGEHTMTGGRMKRVARYLGDEPFLMTYGDGVGDVDITALVAFHRSHGLLATVTTAKPPARWGVLEIEGQRVTSFREKIVSDTDWINAGFFILSPKVLDTIAGDETPWEREPLEQLAHSGQLGAYQHRGFWQPMDNVRDRAVLEELWASGRAPWKVWP
jgi:glucose-1-phosphate cytidylyltransferase